MDPTAESASRLRSEQESQERDPSFRQLMGGIHEVTWLTTPDGADLVYVNSAYESVWGSTCQSLYDNPDSWLDGVHDDDRDRVRSVVDAAKQEPFECDYRILRSDGTPRWIRHRGFAICDAADKVCRHANVAEDVTDCKYAHFEFERFFDSSPDLLVILGFDGCVQRMNAPVGAVGYLTPQDVTSKPFLEFVHPDDRELLQSEIEKLIRGGITRSFEIRALMQDGSYNWFSWSATAFRDTQSIYAAGRDVNDRRLADEALKERTRQQTSVADLGIRALTSRDLSALMTDATEQILAILGVDFVAILELQRDGKEFLLRAGSGWDPAEVANMRVNAGTGTLSGYMLSSNQPVVVTDIHSESRFPESVVLREHGITSAMGCVIPGFERPYGVLNVFSRHRREFTKNDVQFLQSITNIVAAAIERQWTHDELDRFFSPSLNPMIVCGFDGYMKRVNDAVESTSGFTRAELLSEPFLDFAHPDDRELFATAIQKLISGSGATTSSEVRLRCKDGSYKWILWSSTPFPDWEVFYATGHDVTDRHLAEAARDEREAQTRILLDSVAEGIFEIDMQRNCTFNNASCRRILGYEDPEDLLGKQILTLVHHSDLDGKPIPDEECPVQRTLSEGREAHVWEEVLWRRDGTSFPVEYWAYPIRRGNEITGCVVSFIDITQRRKAAEERDRFFSRTATPMCVVGFDGNLEYLNPGAERLFGFPQAEVVGQPLAGLIHPNDRKRAALIGKRIEAGKSDSREYEIRLRCHDGSYKWIAWNSVAFEDHQAFYSIGHDVTDRHVAQEDLAEREQEFQVLFDSLAEGVYRIDLDGNCTFTNATCRQLLGYDAPEDLFGKSMHDLAHHSHPDGTPIPVENCQILRALRQGQKIHVSDEVLWRRDGSSFPAEYWAYPILRRGKVAGYGVSFLDITERRHTERHRDFFLEHSLAPMVILGFDGLFKFTNSVYDKMFGFTHDELLGTPNINAVHPDDRERLAIEVSKVMAGSETRDFEFRNLHKDGSYRWMAWSGVRYLEEQAVYAVGHDVTDRHAAQEDLAEREQEFQVLFDSLAEGVYRIGLDGRCTFTNAACRHLLGYDAPEDLFGSNMHALVHHSYPDGTPMPVENCRILRALRQGQKIHVSDEVLWRRDGSSFPAEYWAYPILRSGKVVGYGVSFLDITDAGTRREIVIFSWNTRWLRWSSWDSTAFSSSQTRCSSRCSGTPTMNC